MEPPAVLIAGTSSVAQKQAHSLGSSPCKLNVALSDAASFSLDHLLASCYFASLQVLAGVVILFSRIIPLEHEPESHPLWRLAVRFGARCAKGMSADVTHVVANVAGTEKVG